MIKKVVRQMLTAQILSALTVSVCLLIDSIMIGRFLGVGAIAAYGLANPILLAIGAVSSMLAAGIQMACSRSIGMGSQLETNRGYSTAIALAAGLSLAGMAAVLLFTAPLATLLGAGVEGELFDSTRDYLRGFIIGTPGSMGCLILVPFLQMGGQSALLIAAVLTMTLTDVALDLLNALVFHGGMFGMGMASSLSYYAAMLVGAFYFLSKRCVFRFSFRLFSLRKLAELFRGGIPTVFTMASTVILTFVMNKLLLGTGGSDAVAAYSVIMSVGNAANCVATGTGGVALTLSGMLYHEEDRTGLRLLLGTMARRTTLLGLCVSALLAAFAPACVGLFIADAGATQDMAVLGLRLFTGGLLPCCLISALKNCYQGTGRIGLTEMISLCEGAVLPCIAALALSRLWGTTGAWLFYICGEWTALLGISLIVWIRARRVRLDAGDYLLLLRDFGVPPEGMLERDIQTLVEVGDAAREARAFCRNQGQGEAFCERVGLCVQQVAGNIVTHGFAGGAGRHLLMRLQNKGDRWVLRFRDDCAAFDPVRHAAQSPDKVGSGLRLMAELSDEIRYTYSLNLNNLTLVFHSAPEGSRP